MSRRPFFIWPVMMGVVLVGLLLAACGPRDTGPTLAPLPTVTPTPRSTPLPTLPTPVPPAVEENPLTMLVLPQDEAAAEDAADAVAARILELSGLAVEVQTVSSYGAIVAQLCGSAPVAGWVDGLAFVVAEASDCADPVLLVRRGAANGFQVDLLAGEAVERLADLTALTQPTAVPADEDATPEADEEPGGGAFCRVSAEDAVTWLVPNLMLYAGNLNPVYDLGVIIDVDDYDAIVDAIYDGDCVAGAVPHGYLESDDLGARRATRRDLTDRVQVLQTSPLVPYDILVFPQTVPLDVRIRLTDVLVQMAADEDDAALLAGLLGQDALARVDAGTFDSFRSFMERTGLDFAALGE
ncbi:MAG: PhnD/SsuA/transferrin family substrate-binding protein [Anaerolineae bacterium]|nr:PhnD/SsuA/transferrin family substrate-binding protein [Anaerolineae bacterium]